MPPLRPLLPSSARDREQQRPSPLKIARKRPPTSLACEKCRLRKTRCDGTKPVCRSCTRLKVECVYRMPTDEIRQEFEGTRERESTYAELFKLLKVMRMKMLLRHCAD